MPRGRHDQVQAPPGRGVGGLTRGAGPARGEPVASQSRSRDGGRPLHRAEPARTSHPDRGPLRPPLSQSEHAGGAEKVAGAYF